MTGPNDPTPLEMRQILERLGERESSPRVRGDLERHSLADIASDMGDEKPEWLIRGVWLKGSYGMVAGAEKTLKSYLTILFSLSIASGRTIKPEWTVNPSGLPVLVFSGEGGRKLWLRRARHLGAILELSEKEVDNLPITVIDGIAPLSSPEFESALTDAIDETPSLGLVVIDPYYSYQGSDGGHAGNVMVMGQKLAQLNSLVSERGIALMVVNHFTKAGAGSLNLSSITQAGGREWSDSWILLAHRKAAEVDRGVFRMEMAVGSRHGYGSNLDVQWDIGTFNLDDLKHEGVPTFSAEPKRAAEPAFSAMAQTVLKFIASNDEKANLPLSRGAIRDQDELGGTKTSRERGLDELIAASLVRVEQYQHPTNKRTFDGYRRALDFENSHVSDLGVNPTDLDSPR